MNAGRVLVVEDDPAIANLLRRALAIKEIEATVAGDGIAGREAWEAGGHDLVLLDVMLPGIGGVELLVERRAAGDETPVILLTARDEEKARGLKAGAQGYVSKPFAVDELLEFVEGHLTGG